MPLALAVLLFCNLWLGPIAVSPAERLSANDIADVAWGPGFIVAGALIAAAIYFRLLAGA